MLTDILKILPRIDNKDLAAMEKNLGNRFTRISKKFGKGLMGVLKSGGLIGLATGFLDKILNPLKETQEAIERTLKASDDIVTNAKQFDTTSGRLFKLVQLGKATGLDADNLYMLITKFQTAVAEAKANPNKPTAVANYVNDEDMAAAFFQFIQELQKMDKKSQLLVQQQVFGEKQILKMADFLQQDFGSLTKELGLDKLSSANLAKNLDKLGNFNDLADKLAAKREIGDVGVKAGSITESMIRARDKAERIALERENRNIRNYENLAAISNTVEKISSGIEAIIGKLGEFITFITPAIEKLIAGVEKFLKSPLLRGIPSLFGGKKGE